MSAATQTFDEWSITVDESGLDEFASPCLGNGFLGFRYGKLFIEPWDSEPLMMLAAELYDGGRQLPLPPWLHADIRIGGALFRWGEGVHKLTQKLDLRTGVASLDDRWEYAAGKSAKISIELLAPRGFRMASLMRMSIDAPEPVSIKCGLKGRKPEESCEFDFSVDCMEASAHCLTPHEGMDIKQSLKLSGSGLAGISTEASDDSAAWLIEAAPKSSIELRHSISLFGSHDCGFSDASFEEILRRNAAEWGSLWARSIQKRKLSLSRRRSVNIMQFHLLTSLNAEALCLAPMGLSFPGWNGCQFWDADFWVFQALLPQWRELAEARIRYRAKRLPVAQAFAGSLGLDGAFFCWKSDNLGRSRVREQAYESEIHLNIWIALAACEHFKAYGDLDFYKEFGLPVVNGIAAFLLSRGAFEGDGLFHIRRILGPDEAVWEMQHRLCDDNFLTNYGAALVFKAANEMSALCGEAVNESWSRAADSIFLPAAAPDGVIPEHAGYDGEGVKQADLILAFHPLGFNPGEEAIRRNVEYYRGKTMAYGPFMTSSIEACLMIKLGNAAEAAELLFSELEKFSRGPYETLCECRDRKSSIFLTGIGGFLQAVRLLPQQH